MKTLVTTIVLLFIGMSAGAQNLEVVGKAKITVMDKVNTADSVVVRLADGTLAIRDVTTLSGPWYLGKDTLDGIVFYIYEGSDGHEHGLIVAKSESTAQWQSPTSTTNANRSWDGVYNMGQMTNSPAKTYVQGLGAGWYLPSIDELSLLWHHRFHANKALFDGGFTLLSKDEAYWSSTEIDATRAFAFSFDDVAGRYYTKTDVYSVRAIRAF